MHFVCRHRTHAGDLLHRQCGDKGIYFIRRHHRQAVRLFPIRGDLGNELIHRHAGRHGDVELFADLLTNGFGNPGSSQVLIGDLADVEVGLIQGQWLNDLGEVGENAAHDFGGLAVLVHLGWYDRQLRAEPHRLRRGHGRTNPIRAGIVIAGCQHASPLGAAPNRHGNPPQLGVVAHFDGCIEAVSVDVDNFALHSERVQRDPGSGTPHRADTSEHQLATENEWTRNCRCANDGHY